jgi:hypothetical protein
VTWIVEFAGMMHVVELAFPLRHGSAPEIEPVLYPKLKRERDETKTAYIMLRDGRRRGADDGVEERGEARGEEEEEEEEEEARSGALARSVDITGQWVAVSRGKRRRCTVTKRQRASNHSERGRQNWFSDFHDPRPTA